MITLGINAAFHDSAAAVVVDGVTLAAAEEERFTRIKHAKRPLPFTAWELPFHAIDYCLAEAGIVLADVDHVAYSFDPRAFFQGRKDGLGTAPALVLPVEALPTNRAARTVAALRPWDNPWDPLFAAYMLNAPRQLVDGVPHHLKRRFAAGSDGHHPFRWHAVDHHLCHQASAFLAAPFPSCAVLTLDGRGERATTTYGAYTGGDGPGRYRGLGEVVMPHSLGLLYERITSHLGFLHSSDEYKVMALAALGTPRHRATLGRHVHVGAEGRYTIDAMNLEELFGPARQPGAAMTQDHFDLAASLQHVLEHTVLEIARWLRKASGEPYLAMAGGVALNCVMNAVLRDSGIFDAVWIQPAAGDAGTALGAALWTDARERHGAAEREGAGGGTGAGIGRIEGLPLAPRRWQMEHAYLGPGYDEAAIEDLLRWARVPYRRPDDLAAATARLLADKAIVGWFQGRMEFGPRALGARSILASPIDPSMQQRLNALKDREDFRPVAPAVPRELLADWFSPAAANGGESPFMLFVYDVRPGQAERIPSACHTDHTARVQTVDALTNPAFHALLQAFGGLTGVPVLVNTSFNVRGEPIVCTPRAAIEAFHSTPLDALAIGPFLVEKTGPASQGAGA